MQCFILNALFSFVDIQQKTASVHTCRHAEKEQCIGGVCWWGISKIYWWENLLATNHSFPHLLCHNSVIFTCFTNFTWCNVVFSCFFCLSRNDFSIGCFLLCLVRSYPCIVQCVRCSLISMLNMHVDLLMGLWGTFSAKSIH